MRSVLEVGDVFSGGQAYYRLVQQIGEGGMGEVWQADDLRLNHRVAIKFMRDDNAAIRARFKREAKLLRTLNHPCIVRIIDDGETPDGRPFLVLELLTGQTLHSFLRKYGALPVETAVQIARDVVTALAVAHDVGIVHRDLKPGNVFLHDSSESNGRQVDVMVIDFGISKDLSSSSETYETAVGTVLGSHGYMSPEQVLGKTVDQKADIWALGMLLYEMIEGRGMFFGTAEQMVRQVLRAPLNPIPWRTKKVPKEVELIVAACLERETSRRTITARELAHRLTHLLETGAPWQHVSDQAPTNTIVIERGRANNMPPPTPQIDAPSVMNAQYPAVISVHEDSERKTKAFDELCDTLRRQVRYAQYFGMGTVGLLAVAAIAAVALTRSATNINNNQKVEVPRASPHPETHPSQPEFDKTAANPATPICALPPPTLIAPPSPATPETASTPAAATSASGGIPKESTPHRNKQQESQPRLLQRQKRTLPPAESRDNTHSNSGDRAPSNELSKSNASKYESP